MHITYLCGKRAIANLWLHPNDGENVWEITRINVPENERGQGLGSKLLDMICADADKEGVTLVLGVLPSGPLKYGALVSWYKRRGFVNSDSPHTMIRRGLCS